MDLIFYCNLYIPEHISSKNNRPIFRSRLGKSKKLRDAESYLTHAFASAQTAPTIDFLVQATIIFHSTKYFTRKGVKSLKCGDLVNLLQLPLDCLEHANVIQNDSLVVSLDGSRIVPSEQNRLEISLYRFVE